jgi:hypothetical protein
MREAHGYIVAGTKVFTNSLKKAPRSMGGFGNMLKKAIFG